MSGVLYWHEIGNPCIKRIMRNIPDNNLGYPILIKLDSGVSGSAFALQTPTKQYLITAKHVLFDDNNKLRGSLAEITRQTGGLDDDSFDKISIDFSIAKPIFNPNADVAAILLGNSIAAGNDIYITNFYSGIKKIKECKDKTITVDATTGTKLLKDVLISNDVILYGYPSSLGLFHSPQFDYNKPLLRKGIVASVNKNQSTIILDCPVYYGNSGGPVVEIEFDGQNYQHRVIGVVSQFIPFQQNWTNDKNGLVHTEWLNSGYSVVVSMDKVFELINHTP